MEIWRSQTESPRPKPRRFQQQPGCVLELVPEELVIDLVMELHFLRLDERSQQARATVSGCLLKIGKASLYIFTEQLRCPR